MGAWCALTELMSLSASSLDAVGLAGEAAGGEMVADTALGLAVAHLDPDRLSCPNVHRILALGIPCQIEDVRDSFAHIEHAQGSLPSCSI